MFDWGQKLTIYARAYKKARKQSKEEAECEICKKPTPIDKGAADHKATQPRWIDNSGKWTMDMHSMQQC